MLHPNITNAIQHARENKSSLTSVLAALILLAGEIYVVIADTIIPYLGHNNTSSPTDFALYYEAVFRFSKQPESLYLEISKTTLWGYLYPPPSILLFFPFSCLSLGVAYSLFVILSYGMLFVSLNIWFKYSERNKLNVPGRTRTALILCALASGPMYHNATAGQVNVLVLFTCVMYLLLLDRQRPGWAGFFLAIGISIKIYPIILCMLGLRNRTGLKSILWALGSTLTIGVLLLPWVPFRTYLIYFRDLLPAMSHLINVNIINQSVSAFLMRFSIPPMEFFDWAPHPLNVWIQTSNALLLFSLCAFLSVLSRKESPANRITVEACLLATIPLFSPLGWGHAYIFTLPILLLTLHDLFAGKLLFKCLAVCVYLAITIPVYHQFNFAEGLPDVFQNLIYSRYLLVILLCGVLELFVFGRERA